MRFALIGSNFVVDWFVEAARQCPDVELQVAYSRTEKQAQSNAEKWGIPHACWDIAALATHPDVDAVYIASPNLFHAEQIEAMLQGGKHVFCEKPIVPSEAQLYPLLALAEERGLLLLEAIRPAFLPAMQQLRDLLPKLGVLRYAEFAYAQYSSRYERFLQGIVENAFDPTLCNGTLIDLGVYCVAWMLGLFGEPSSIQSTAFFLKDSIDASGAALCGYDAFQVLLRYSKVHGSDQPAVIEGENGLLRFSPFPIPHTAQLCLRGEESVSIALDGEPHDMRYEIEAFVACAKDPSKAKRYQQQSAATLRVMDTIRAQCGIDFRKK